jgi:DNA-binding transcriptional MerR regulator
MVQKSPDAFRTISEVASTLDLPAHVLRFWESRFSQIRPIKRGGGRRYYRPQDVNLLRGIRDLLHSDGESIKSVQKILREQGVRHVAALGTDDAANDTGKPAPVPAPKPVTARRPGPVPPLPSGPAPSAPAVPRPAARPVTAPASAPVRAASTGRQRDLFDDYQPIPAAAPAPGPVPEARKREIRALRDRLVALRDSMQAQE